MLWRELAAPQSVVNRVSISGTGTPLIIKILDFLELIYFNLLTCELPKINNRNTRTAPRFIFETTNSCRINFYVWIKIKLESKDIISNRNVKFELST